MSRLLSTIHVIRTGWRPQNLPIVAVRVVGLEPFKVIEAIIN